MTYLARYTKAIRAIHKANRTLEKTVKEYRENKNIQTKAPEDQSQGR